MKLAILDEIQQVFLNKYSLLLKPLVNFQNSKRVDSDNLASVLTAFMEEMIFRSPYSGIFTDISLIQRI